MTPAPTLALSGAARIGGKQIFSGVDLTIPAGQITCLLGPSGVGKSTVLRLLAGLGQGIDFDGDLQTAPAALMAQDDLLLPWASLRENVVLGARLRGHSPDMSRADRLIAQVGLAEHASKRPTALSGGQRQRVALARTLMEDRPAVLLDEPFSALDLRTRVQMQDLAARLLAGRTLLIVTHDAAEAARMADQIILMSGDGARLVPAPGTPVPRPADAPETLRCQAALLADLLEEGA